MRAASLPTLRGRVRTQAMDDLRPLRSPRRPRKRPRTPNPEARSRLLDAANALIADQGVPRLRVEDVAQRAGLSVGTFYLYFESKKDLFTQLVVEHTRRLRERMRAAYAGPGSLEERIAASLDAYLDHVEENAKGFLYFRDAGTIQTTGGSLSSWAIRQHVEDLRPLLEEGMASGEFRPQPAELAAQAIVGLVQHMAGYWLEHREACSREELKRLLLRLTGVGLQR